jgi:OOP family OmpA-OmpF porin
MKMYYARALFFVIFSTLLFSCASPQVQPSRSLFNPSQLQVDQYQPKIDNFVVILDTSSSMSDDYNGFSKFKIAQDYLSALNQTLPEFNYNGALRTFGNISNTPDKMTLLVYGPTKYSTALFESALKGVKVSGGTSSLPLAEAIADTGNDLKSARGTTAIIIVSDGEDMDQMPVKASQNLKDQLGDRVCIYTIHIGDDPAGANQMNRIAESSACGFPVTVVGHKTKSTMGDLVERIFLTKVEKPAPKPAPVAKPMDSDKDGVTDNLDQCPNTPLGATVDARGCWTYEAKVLFDINSAKVKSEAYPMLQEAVLIMKKNPDLMVEVDGHADSTGAAEYNMALSEKRAEAVKKYFVDQGIDPDRLTTKGFGITKPAASNKTKEGRAKNRRVELTPVQ